MTMPTSISESLPSLGSRQKGSICGPEADLQPVSLPGGRRRSNGKQVTRSPSALGIETTISELDLGSHSDEEAVGGQQELKVLSIDDIHGGPGKPYVNHPVALKKKKTTTSAFLARQRLKGLTSSPADNTFSPVTRQFLRRDASNGIMKKTNIQRVIAERRLNGCNGAAGNTGASKNPSRHPHTSVHTAASSPAVTPKCNLGPLRRHLDSFHRLEK